MNLREFYLAPLGKLQYKVWFGGSLMSLNRNPEGYRGSFPKINGLIKRLRMTPLFVSWFSFGKIGLLASFNLCGFWSNIKGVSSL